MSLARKVLVNFMILTLIFTLMSPVQKSLAASTSNGLSKMTDPLAIQMENGKTLVWNNVHPTLLSAKAKYEKLLKDKGWRIQYTSAYRPYQYQKHLYEILTGPSNSAKNAEIKKHGLVGKVAAPSANAPHTKGIAFDAIVYDKSGRALNGGKFVNSSLVSVAKQAGLAFYHPTDDGVHHQLIVSTTPTPVPKETPYNTIAKIMTPSGLNVRKSASESAARIGGVYKNELVTIVAKAGSFYKIKFKTGYGYISNNSSYSTIQTPTVKETPYNAIAKITTPSGLNVRKSASESAARIGGVYKNNTVTIVARAGDFYKIKFGNGYGYISNNSSYSTIQTTIVPLKPPTGTTNKYNVSVSYQKALDIQVKVNSQISKGGRWVNASRSEVDTYMNPQKILNDPTQKYQFLDISQYEGVSETEIANYLKDKGVLAGKASIFMKAAKDFKISPIYLVAHASLETGNGKSALANGYVSKLGYTKGKKVYNVYGYGADDAPKRNGIDYVLENGANYAYKAGWLTLDKAIYNGAQTISKYHFNGKYNQSTLYENRWNPKSPGVNQYATDVRWAYNQAADLKKMYDKFPKAKLVFKVPVYK